MAVIGTITAPGGASAHGDPASHYLETDPLYPSFARQPSVEVQLQLLGLLHASERRGYPIKVAIVAGAEDLVDDLAMMRLPQRYAGTVASTIELARTAMAAVRRVARAGGHPLPARVAPAEQPTPPPATGRLRSPAASGARGAW